MEIIIWPLSNDTLKDLERGKTTLAFVLEGLESSENKFSTGKYWAGLDYLLSKYPSKNDLKTFLTKGGLEVGETRVFKSDQVKSILAFLSKIDFDKLKGSVTLKEMVNAEVYPFKDTDNPVRVFIEIKKTLECVTDEIERIAERHIGMLIMTNAEFIH